MRLSLPSFVPQRIPRAFWIKSRPNASPTKEQTLSGSSSNPNSKVLTYLENEEATLFPKLKGILSPSGWKPFEREFVRGEEGVGVYAIVGISKDLDSVKIRVGQTEDQDLRTRLEQHLSGVRDQFPTESPPVFYNTRHIARKNLDLAEQALFHLVPSALRIPGSAHPSRCRFHEAGFS